MRLKRFLARLVLPHLSTSVYLHSIHRNYLGKSEINAEVIVYNDLELGEYYLVRKEK